MLLETEGRVNTEVLKGDEDEPERKRGRRGTRFCCSLCFSLVSGKKSLWVKIK